MTNRRQQIKLLGTALTTGSFKSVPLDLGSTDRVSYQVIISGVVNGTASIGVSDEPWSMNEISSVPEAARLKGLPSAYSDGFDATFVTVSSPDTEVVLNDSVSTDGMSGSISYNLKAYSQWQRFQWETGAGTNTGNLTVYVSTRG